MSKPLILIADDDPHIRDVLRYALSRDGHAVIEAGDGAEALRLAAEKSPNLVILDVMMPEQDGLAVCRSLRSGSATLPILFLSSRDDEIDRVLGLELGADDYVTKPFSPRELSARVKALLRRSEALRQPAAPAVEGGLRHGKLAIDADRFSASWDGTAVPLSVTEFNLLKTMATRPGIVFTRDMLMDGAYADHRYVSDRTIDSHIRRLRAKLAEAGGDPIETVHGLGYKLA